LPTAQQRKVRDGRECTAETVLRGVIRVGAGAHARDHIAERQLFLDRTRRADADDVIHIILREQLIGIDTDGRHAHAGGHDGDLDTLVGAGVALHAPDVVDEDGVFQEILGDEFAAQRVAGHQYGLAEITGLCGNMRGGGWEHSNHPFVSVIL